MKRIGITSASLSLLILSGLGCSGGQTQTEAAKVPEKPKIKVLDNGKKLVNRSFAPVMGDPNSPHGIPTTPGDKFKGGN